MNEKPKINMSKKTRNKPSPLTEKAKNFITHSLRTYEDLRREPRPDIDITTYHFQRSEDFYNKMYEIDRNECPSLNTFRTAITILKTESFIVKTNEGIYELAQSLKGKSLFFPIIEIASGINIYPLNHNDIHFFRVYPNMSTEVARYLNYEFNSNDIYTVPLGDVIMCIDVEIPSNSSIVRKKGGTLQNRVLRKLRNSQFVIQEPTGPKVKGYTEEELLELEALNYLKQKQQEENLPKYGGVIKSRSSNLPPDKIRKNNK